MRRIAVILAFAAAFAAHASPQDKGPDPAVTLKAVVDEIDYLKRHLMVVAQRRPELVADLRKQRPDLGSLLDDVERAVRALDGEMKKLAAALESDDVEARDAAAARIVALGPVAAPHLRALLTSENAEVRAQAEALLAKLETPARPKDAAAVVRRMEVFDVRDLTEALAAARIDLKEAVAKVIELRPGESIDSHKSGLLLARCHPDTAVRLRELIDVLHAAAKR